MPQHRLPDVRLRRAVGVARVRPRDAGDARPRRVRRAGRRAARPRPAPRRTGSTRPSSSPGTRSSRIPAETASILEAGHEIAHHSYAHIDPSGQIRDEEAADMDRAFEVLAAIGVTPLGFRSPSADLSDATPRARRGARVPLRLEPHDGRLPPVSPADRRRGRARRAARARPRGAGSGSCRCSFELDDWVHFQFNFDPYRKGGAPPRHVREIWEAEFDWMDANVRRRRARRHHAPAGDRPRLADRDARRVHPPLRRGRRAVPADGRGRARARLGR